MDRFNKLPVLLQILIVWCTFPLALYGGVQLIMLLISNGFGWILLIPMAILIGRLILNVVLNRTRLK